MQFHRACQSSQANFIRPERDVNSEVYRRGTNQRGLHRKVCTCQPRSSISGQVLSVIQTGQQIVPTCRVLSARQSPQLFKQKQEVDKSFDQALYC